MRRFLSMALAAICAGQGIGCCSCGAKTGWGVWIGRPSTIAPEVMAPPSLLTHGMQGVATLPALGAAVGAPMAAAAPICAATSASPAIPRLQPAVDPCLGATLEDLCRQIRTMNASLNVAVQRMQAAPLPKPMPKGGD